jgi:hypothetical protein
VSKTKNGTKLVRFYLFVVIVFSIFWFLAYRVAQQPFVEAKVRSLSNLQEKQLDTFNEMNRLLTTLATLALGGMGAFLFNRYKNDSLPWYQVWRAVGSWIFAGISLYCGYLGYAQTAWMLDKGFFNLSNPNIVWFSRVQFWTFAISTFLMADFVFHTLRRPETERE